MESTETDDRYEDKSVLQEPMVDFEVEFIDDQDGLVAWSDDDDCVFADLLDFALENDVVLDSNSPSEPVESMRKSKPTDVKKSIPATQSKHKTKRCKKQIDPNDIRLRYLDDFTDVNNSADPDRLWEVLQARSTPDRLHIERLFDDVPGTVMYREMRGIEQIYKYTVATWAALPDLTFVLTGRKLCLRTDGTSYLVGTLNVAGSWIFELNPANIINTSKNILSKWNPFTKLYNIIMKPSETHTLTSPDHASVESVDSGSSKLEAKDEKKSTDPLNEDAKANFSPSASSTEVAKPRSAPDVLKSAFPKSVRGQANPTITSIDIPQDCIQVSTKDTSFDTSQKKRRPFRYHLSVTMVCHLNKDLKIYRSEFIKRGKATYDVDLSVPSPFDGEI